MTEKFPILNSELASDVANNVANNVASNVARDRAENGGRIHLDNCGASLMPLPVREVMVRHQNLEFAVGGYVAAERAAEQMDSVYDCLAMAFGGNRADYALAGSAVDAWTKAFYSLPIKSGDNIVVPYNDYCSNYVAYLHLSQRIGFEIRVAQMGADFSLDLDHLESLIDDRTALLSMVHVPCNSGQVNPVSAVGDIAGRKGIPFLLDICQSAGQMAVDVEAIGCDMATGTARKFLRGPRGVGFLYMSEKMRSLVDPVVMTNQSAAWTATNSITPRDDTRIFEAWERNVVAQLGFGAALRYFLDVGPDAIERQIRAVSDRFRAALNSHEKIVNTCPPNSTAGIITFNSAGIAPSILKERMEIAGIAVQVASVFHARLDMEARGIDNCVRISPHYFTTESDFNTFLAVLDQMIDE